MAVFVSVRGFLQCDDRSWPSSNGSSAPRGRLPVQRGVGPARPYYNWIHYVFYGADIHADSVEPMLELLRTIARIPPSDDDNDHVTGLFHASHEIEG